MWNEFVPNGMKLFQYKRPILIICICSVMTRHRWVELHNTRLGTGWDTKKKEYIKSSPALNTSHSSRITIYWFYFYEGFFSYHKTIPYMGFQFFVRFLMWKDCNSLDILSRGDLSWEQDNRFFTPQIRGDINKPERRPIKTDIKKRTGLTRLPVNNCLHHPRYT